MARIVVTGARGFVGRHLTAGLAERGFEAIAVSRRPAPGVVAVDDYRRCPDGDALVHLAEEPDRGKVNSLGDSYLQESAAVLLALSARFGERLVYASSSVVYGDQSALPCKVTAPVAGNDTYSRSKLANERIVLAAGGAVVRLSNLVGTGMGSGNVVSDIIRQIRGSGELRVRDDTPVRDFLHVSDAVSAFGMVLEKGFTGTVNVGSGIGTSIRALAELALEVAGQRGRPVIATAPSARRSVTVLDISETTKVLGWIPALSLGQQLSSMLSSQEN